MSEKDEKAQGPGQVQTPDDASARRAAHVSALEEERRGYEVRGLKDRVAQVDSELAKFGKAPKGRSAKPADKA